MSNQNWRPNWLERWGFRVPGPLEFTEPSEEKLRCEKETQELVEKAVQERMDAGIRADD